MQHSFNVEIAKKYGILEAVLLNHLWFWIKRNKANNTNYFDGNYWTFNSTKAFSELFPYVSERQIKYALKHLREEEIIKVGNYNKDTRDRTLWYAFTEKGEAIVQNCPMESSFLSDTKVGNVRALPDIKPNINTDINNNTTTKYINNNSSNNINNNIFTYIEENLGRTLSPLECEEIMTWEDNDLTRYAIKEAVLNGKYTIGYIRGILHNYRQNNIQTVLQAKMLKEEYQKKKTNSYEMKQEKTPYEKRMEMFDRVAKKIKEKEENENRTD